MLIGEEVLKMEQFFRVEVLEAVLQGQHDLRHGHLSPTEATDPAGEQQAVHKSQPRCRTTFSRFAITFSTAAHQNTSSLAKKGDGFNGEHTQNKTPRKKLILSRCTLYDA